MNHQADIRLVIITLEDQIHDAGEDRGLAAVGCSLPDNRKSMDRRALRECGADDIQGDFVQQPGTEPGFDFAAQIR